MKRFDFGFEISDCGFRIGILFFQFFDSFFNLKSPIPNPKYLPAPPGCLLFAENIAEERAAD